MTLKRYSSTYFRIVDQFLNLRSMDSSRVCRVGRGPMDGCIETHLSLKLYVNVSIYSGPSISSGSPSSESTNPGWKIFGRKKTIKNNSKNNVNLKIQYSNYLHCGYCK